MTTHRRSAEHQPVPLRHRPADERPLTRTQSQIWTAQRLHPDVPLANMGKRHRVRGDLDHARLAAAFDLVVRSSDMLRSVVVDDRTRPRLRILAEPPASTEIVDLDADQLDAWCAARIARPVDVTTCAYDSVLLRHGPGDTTWWLDLHHIVTDAWSSAVVFEATARAYERLGPSSPDHAVGEDAVGEDAVGGDLDLDLVGFAEHVDAVATRSTDEQRARRAQAWQDAAATFGTPSPLTPYGPRGATTTAVERLPVPLGDGREVALRTALAGAYRTLSNELSLLGLLVTTTVVALHRLDGRDDVSVGVPIHHRSGPRAPHVVGPLMELYPLRVTVEPGESHASLFARVQRGIVDVLRLARPGESPDADFEVVVNVLTARYADLPGLDTTTEWMRSGHVEPRHVVRVQAYDYGDALRIELDLNEALSADRSHRSMPGHVAALLDAAIADPAASIGDVTIATTDELAALEALNPAATHDPIDEPVHLRIGRLLRADPAAIVATDGERSLSAGELDGGADSLARWLAARGATPGDRVAIRMRRSPEVLIAVHGVMRSGAAFVMLDPDDPPARHETIAADADLGLIVDRLPDAAELAEAVDAAIELPDVDLDATAYVLYTSGSTGVPKGVPISHRGLADYLAFAVDAYVEPGGEVVMPLFSRLVFDLTITSLFLPTLAGGRIVVVPDDGVEGLADIARNPQITVLKATPSQLDLLMRMVDGPLAVGTVIVGGEAFRRPLAEQLARHGPSEVRIFNEYGPTEAVVGCMIHRWRPQDDVDADVPIGHASPGAEVFVLDRYGRRTPPGAWGELYVRRPGMATGYLNRPELSAELFASVDGIDGPPLYRTGDRARVTRPGVLVYGGRLDDQLKVGGVRLEPGEIEAALVAHPGVDQAVVRVWRRAPAPVTVRRCTRCGLGDDVPGVEIDHHDRCDVCRRFDEVAPQTTTWFGTRDDLDERRRAARARRRGTADCLHLLSGGKDSTYALYQLVEQGWDVHALTLDNGFISPGAIDNIRRTVADLGITHEFVTTDAMNEIFRDSLDRFANVCNGCYKTIYTLAIARAHELGIPVITTGLSRGQFFETRLVPHQFEAGRFDPEAIDATVLEARRVYHRTSDAVTRLLPEQQVVERDDIFDEIEFVDFYRYVDVDLDELYDFLERRAPWVRPADTGRSTNCLINDVGIWVHRRERGFHNYAEPYSWDVRLGHKTRAAALDELDDDIDEAAVHRMLAEIGYEPKIDGLLTAWYRPAGDDDLDPDDLREHLRRRLPEHAVPAAFVRIDRIPLAASAKVDVGALPAPTRVHRGGGGYEPPQSPTEERISEIWRAVLGIDRVGATDDFFDLGGASLSALDTVARIDDALRVDLPDAAVFRHRTVRELAAEVDAVLARRSAVGPAIDGVGGALVTDMTSPIEHRPDLPLSAGQEAILFEYRIDPTTSRYGVTRRYRLDPELDARRLQDALLTVIGAHDTLRTTFASPRVRLDAAAALDWREVAATDGAGLEALALRQAAEPFDVDTGPLVRATLVEGGEPTLLLSMHHLWCDAGSFDIVWRDLALAYAGESVSAPAVTYSEHAAWQRERIGADAHDRWAEILAEVDGAPDLELLRPEIVEPDGYLRHEVVLDADRRRGGSVFPAFLAAVDVVVSSLTDDPVVVGVPMSVRDRVEVADVVGYFLNTVALPLPATDDGAAFGDVLARTEDVLASAIRHRTVPFAEVMGERHRAGRATDLASIMVVHDPPPTSVLDGVEVTGETVFNGTAVTDLSFLVTETDAGCVIAAEWSGARFAASDVERVVGWLGSVLAAGLADPGAAVVDLVPRAADTFGPTLDDDGTTVVDRIWSVAAGTPEAPVVRQQDEMLDAASFVARAEAVAAGLAARGVRPGDRVALVLPPSVDQVTAILGVLRAGAAYVPVDPTYPGERIDTLLAQSRPRLIVRPADLVELSQVGGEVDLPPLPQPDDPAYVIFTSATTGPPKGVEVRHRQLAASTRARDLVYDRPPGRFAWVSSFGFDSSVVGLFWTLATGGELVLPEAGRHTDVDHLIALIADRSVTHVLMVPSLWSAVLRRTASAGTGADALSSLTDVIVAGEALTSPTVASHFRLLPVTALWNEYGPTETTVWATVHRCLDPAERPVPIGRPVPGAVVRVAGADRRARPAEVAGELLIGGAGLTDGYPGDPEATRERFVADPDEPSRRWYRSGDRCTVDAGGVVRFHGRLDDQLSVHGVRVEPDEIEGAIATFPGVSAAVVGLTEGRNGSRLDAHVESARDVDTDELRRHVAARLPGTHVPSRWFVHRSFVRTTHGKIDRRRTLAATASAAPSAADDHDPMLAVWGDVLGADGLDADTDFFEAGGNSLSAVELVIAVEERLGREVSIGELLNARTPRRLADALGIAVAGDVPAGGDRLVVFTDVVSDHTVVHVPAWDDVFGYVPLRDALDRTLPAPTRQLALHYRTADHPDPLVHVEALAELFADDLAAAGELDRPTVVVGWSTSGLVAYDLARRLHERGTSVTAVVLVDTFFPGEERRRWANRFGKYAPLLRPGNFGEAAREARITVRRRTRRLVAGLGRRVLQWADPDALVSSPTATRRVSTANPDEAFEYEPVGIDVPVVLLAASTTSPARTIEPWRVVCLDLTVVPVEGRHRGFDSIMGDERVDQVAHAVTALVRGDDIRH